MLQCIAYSCTLCHAHVFPLILFTNLTCESRLSVSVSTSMSGFVSVSVSVSVSMSVSMSMSVSVSMSISHCVYAYMCVCIYIYICVRKIGSMKQTTLQTPPRDNVSFFILMV